MAATSKSNYSPKQRAQINDSRKIKHKKVTKGYKQSHSIGSRKTKVVTYSEAIPIYESVLAIYLEHSKKRNDSSNSSPEPSNYISSKEDTNLIPRASCSNSLQTELKVEESNSMVGGKSKGHKSCVSSKIKKENSSGMIAKIEKCNSLKDLNKKLFNARKKKRASKEKRTPKHNAEKNTPEIKVKITKIKKEKSSCKKVAKVRKAEKGLKEAKGKVSARTKTEKSKPLISDQVGIENKSKRLMSLSKTSKSKSQENKRENLKTPNKSNGLDKKGEACKRPDKSQNFENWDDKSKKVVNDNVNKSNKRKHDQTTNGIKEKTPIKRKLPKIENKVKKKDIKISPKMTHKQKLQQKQRRAEKKKLKCENMTKSLLDIFSLVRMKREASLNASARVNIMFEKLPPSPKTKTDMNANHSKAVTEVGKDNSPNIQCEKKKKDSNKETLEKTKNDNKKTSKKDENTKSLKDKKCASDIKKVKDKTKAKKKEKSVMPIQGCVRRMASLNAQAIMAATKEFETEPSERAARIDRYCVAWQCEPLATRITSAANWVDGLGKTCCVAQTSTCYTTAPKSDSAVPEGSKLPAITLMDGETIEDRPASVVDVTSHVATNPFLPLPPPQQCIGTFFSQSHSCVPPCSGCCNADGYMSTSQFKSFQLGSLSSLNSLQMMTYGHPGHAYRSAFSVPYNHAGIPHYGYYSNNYYQPTTGPVIQSDPCLVSHHVPIQVPQAQVKVLIHNPDPSHDHCAFSDAGSVKGSKDEIKQLSVSKRRSSSETKSKLIDKQKTDLLKSKRKYERKRSKSPSKEEPEIKCVNILENPIIPSHGWSWHGESEWKKIPNVVDGPPRQRKCYSAMKHVDGDIINICDCVLLRSGPRKKDIPFVAKVSALWENADDGEIMMSLLWYYRPEHTEAGRKPFHLDNELFACKHRDENSVACIDDKSYVLTYNEYCRFKAEQHRLESHLPPRQNVVPNLEDNLAKRKRMPPFDVNPDNVFLCRQVYDFRQHRILKNPS